MLRIDDLNYDYPEDLIALEARPRGESRILHIPRENEKWKELDWLDLWKMFQPGEVLILNDSKVIRARLIVKKPSGAEGEIFFLRASGSEWEVLTGSLNLKSGQIFELPGNLTAAVVNRTGRFSRLR